MFLNVIKEEYLHIYAHDVDNFFDSFLSLQGAGGRVSSARMAAPAAGTQRGGGRPE